MSSLVSENLSDLMYNANLFESGIKDFGVKLNLDIVPSPIHYIRMGIDFTRHTFTPGLIYINQNGAIIPEEEPVTLGHLESLLNNTNTLANEINAYIEDDISFSPGFRANLGLRASIFSEDSKSFLSLQPRVSIVDDNNNILDVPESSRKAVYRLPVGANIIVNDGAVVSMGFAIAKVQRETTKTKDIITRTFKKC